MKAIDLNSVQEQQNFARLIPGGYIAKITHVEDVPTKEYLKIEYDIAEGQFAGYFKDLMDRKLFWGGKFVRSYKETALSFFKHFINSIAESNQGFAWTSNESQLIGKKIGIVLAEEEYGKQDGSVGVRLYVADTRSTDKIKSGDFKTPPLKKLKQLSPNTPFGASDFGVDVPF